MTPIYNRLPAVSGFGVEKTADTIGAAIAAGVTAGVAIHAVATGIQRARQSKETEVYEETVTESEG
jgi:hydrogenase small subunit